MPTGILRTFELMNFELTRVDGQAEAIRGADTYEQEGPLTTFFSTHGREFVDSWSVRLASFRTSDIASIRRLEEPTSADEGDQVAWIVDHRNGARIA